MDDRPPLLHRLRLVSRGLAWLLAAWLAGCATRPATDGPGARPPSGLERTPDAEPRIEPVRAGGPNKPYEVMGQRYVPVTADAPLSESGLASWYGRKFHGQPTSSGEPYDMYAMTAAHKTMPIPSYARVRNPANGREVIVRVNDRGPFVPGRVIDLSYTAAMRLGLLGGVAPVEVQRITHAEIRAGVRLPAAAPVTVAAPAPAAAAPVAVAPVVVAAAAVVPSAAAASPSPPAAATLPDPAPPAGAASALPPDDPSPVDRPPPDATGSWLQLAAFRSREAAAGLQQRLLLETADLPGVALVEGGGWVRVQAGPYATRSLALQASERLQRQHGLAAVLITRGGPSPTQ